MAWRETVGEEEGEEKRECKGQNSIGSHFPAIKKLQVLESNASGIYK